jgi:DnaA family protein
LGAITAKYNFGVKQLVLDLIPTPAPTLANFVAGRNAEAVTALKSTFDPARGGTMAKVLYLWGAVGSGKSHLIQACKAHDERFRTVDLPFEDEGADQGFAIDDVENLDETAQQVLFNLINRQLGSGGVIVAAGSAAPRDLPLRRDLASRLGSGLTFQLYPLSDGEKADALRAHARDRGFALRDDVITYLLRHARRDMASLIGMLDALDKYSIETGREITLPLLREISQPSLV